jgi:hypothetical protein|eukprot:TRINITY_DN87546_c0_g1_i1.p1 TRINITY_DN87546_c0_g1~~TRINITY_DN87546_c0_g1_i1.p1  ORF type:complete len:119 (+),score=12.20 TRINITY_DN87546_c0_g1_i1:176-532(+)
MKRILLVVLSLILCFVLAGSGIYRYLSSRDQQPFLKADPADLAGTWQNKATSITIEVAGEGLKVDGVPFVRDGKAPRYVEKSPKTNVPRVLELNGAGVTLTSVSDSDQRSVEALERVK